MTKLLGRLRAGGASFSNHHQAPTRANCPMTRMNYLKMSRPRRLGVVGQMRNLALLHLVCQEHVVHGPAPSRGSKLLQGSPTL